MSLAIGACGALLDYARKTQGQALAHVNAVLAERSAEFLRLDAATRRNLELTETLRGEPAPTLFSQLDRCASGMGSRLLRHWLHHPLRNRDAVAKRHEAVEALQVGSEKVHATLRRFADVERPVGLAFGPSGDLYVAQPQVGKISKITPGGKRITLLQGLDEPRDPAFDASGNLYVAETGTGRILKLTGTY